MGEANKPKTFRLSDETIRQLAELQGVLGPMSVNPTDTLRIVIALAHADVCEGQKVQPLWSALQGLQSKTLYDAPTQHTLAFPSQWERQMDSWMRDAREANKRHDLMRARIRERRVAEADRRRA